MPKVSQLSELSSVDASDLLVVADSSAGQSKKITSQNFMRSLPGAILPSNIDIAVDDATERDSLTPFAGMIVFQEDTEMLQIFDGTEWQNVPRLLRRVVLTSSASSISVTGIPLRDSLRAKIYLKATGGTILGTVRLNNDSANNYAQNGSSGGGAYSAVASKSGIDLFAAAETYSQLSTVEIGNHSGDFKTLDVASQDMFGTDATTTSNFWNARGKWANTSQLNRLDVIKTGTGSFAVGSYVEIYG